MNSLCSLISMLGLSEVAVMNGLQGEAGLVSDLCVNASDVAGLNCYRACEWVLANQERLR
jgi:hypothetical protein